MICYLLSLNLFIFALLIEPESKSQPARLHHVEKCFFNNNNWRTGSANYIP